MRLDPVERELERRLVAERPQPRPEFVGTLVQQLPRPERRSGLGALSRVALVAALTALVAVAVGLSRAGGDASSSLHHLADNLRRVVSSRPDAAAGSGSLYIQSFNEHDLGFVPYHHQFGVQIPLCRYESTAVLPVEEYVYLRLRGDRAALACRS